MAVRRRSALLVVEEPVKERIEEVVDDEQHGEGQDGVEESEL